MYLIIFISFSISYSHHTQKYEVHDIDEEQKPRHILSKRRVIPLPLYRANPETDIHALFPKGTVVMALYPQTTCFYKGKLNLKVNPSIKAGLSLNLRIKVAVLSLNNFLNSSNNQRLTFKCKTRL